MAGAGGWGAAGGEPGVKQGLWVALRAALAFSDGSEVPCPAPYEMKTAQAWQEHPSARDCSTCKPGGEEDLQVAWELLYGPRGGKGTLSPLDPAVFQAPA